MSIRALLRPVPPVGKVLVRPLAAVLLMSTALPTFAGAAIPTDRPLAAAQDAGPIDPTTPTMATIWLLDRADAPWYPTVTLHRQNAPGQWDGAIAKMIRTVMEGTVVDLAA